MPKDKKDQYRTVTIQAAKNGWIVMQTGRITEVYIRWDELVKRIKDELTS